MGKVAWPSPGLESFESRRWRCSSTYQTKFSIAEGFLLIWSNSETLGGTLTPLHCIYSSASSLRAMLCCHSHHLFQGLFFSVLLHPILNEGR